MEAPTGPVSGPPQYTPLLQWAAKFFLEAIEKMDFEPLRQI